MCALCVHDSSEGHKAVMGLVMGLSYAKGGRGRNGVSRGLFKRIGEEREGGRGEGGGNILSVGV